MKNSCSENFNTGKVISFTVFGKVEGKARPRVTKYGTYTPPKTKAKENEIAWRYKASGGTMMDGEIAVVIHVFRELPKSRPKKVESEPDLFKPDIDNIAKLVMDALNGVAYHDDAQVASLVVRKHPRTRIKERTLIFVCEKKRKEAGS